jgi:hypothetical protein
MSTAVVGTNYHQPTHLVTLRTRSTGWLATFSGNDTMINEPGSRSVLEDEDFFGCLWILDLATMTIGDSVTFNLSAWTIHEWMKVNLALIAL